MAKITSKDLINLGFTQELFHKDVTGDFETFIEEIIAEISINLQNKVGATTYASTISPTKDYIKNTEKCLVAAELLQRRINIVLGDTSVEGEARDVKNERQQRNDYLNKASDWFMKISPLTANEFSTEMLETSHFDSSS